MAAALNFTDYLVSIRMPNVTKIVNHSNRVIFIFYYSEVFFALLHHARILFSAESFCKFTDVIKISKIH